MSEFRCYALAVSFYRATRGLKLPVHLRDQLDRAASSVALNLAEARGRQSAADQKRFFGIALGSARECRAILELAGFERSSTLGDAADHLTASVFKLVRGA